MRILSAGSVMVHPPFRGLRERPENHIELVSAAVAADVSPEPPPAERAALLRALEQLAERGRELRPETSAWWVAGVRENVSAEPRGLAPAVIYATAFARSTPG